MFKNESVILHYKHTGNGRPLIILHGLFGSGENWQTIAKHIAEKGFSVYMPDARNHGLSPHAASHTYYDMANDLHDFIQQHSLEKPIILGHSMGGKTAMTFVNRFPDAASKLIVVDISPRAYPLHHQAYIHAMTTLPEHSLTSRTEVEQHFISMGITNLMERQFLMKNLSRNNDDNTFFWRINLAVLAAQIENIGASTLPDAPIYLPTLFIKGGKSDFYITDTDFEVIHHSYPNARIVTIENAGHWVHAEQPTQFLNAVLPFIQD